MFSVITMALELGIGCSITEMCFYSCMVVWCITIHVKSPIHEGGCPDPLIYINVISFSNTSSLLCF